MFYYLWFCFWCFLFVVFLFVFARLSVMGLGKPRRRGLSCVRDRTRYPAMRSCRIWMPRWAGLECDHLSRSRDWQRKRVQCFRGWAVAVAFSAGWAGKYKLKKQWAEKSTRGWMNVFFFFTEYSKSRFKMQTRPLWEPKIKCFVLLDKIWVSKDFPVHLKDFIQHPLNKDKVGWEGRWQ